MEARKRVWCVFEVMLGNKQVLSKHSSQAQTHPLKTENRGCIFVTSWKHHDIQSQKRASFFKTYGSLHEKQTNMEILNVNVDLLNWISPVWFARLCALACGCIHIFQCIFVFIFLLLKVKADSCTSICVRHTRNKYKCTQNEVDRHK